ILPDAGTVTEPASVTQLGVTPSTASAYVSGAVVGFFTVTVYSASCPGATVWVAGLRPRMCSLVTETWDSGIVPEPSGVVNATLPPSATGTTWPGEIPVTFDVQVIVVFPGLSQLTVSKPEPVVMLVGGTLKDVGSYATVPFLSIWTVALYCVPPTPGIEYVVSPLGPTV